MSTMLLLLAMLLLMVAVVMVELGFSAFVHLQAAIGGSAPLIVGNWAATGMMTTVVCSGCR